MYVCKSCEQQVRGMDGGRGHLFKIVGISHTGNSDGSWGSARQAWMWGCVRDHGVKSLVSVETRTILAQFCPCMRRQQGAEHTDVSEQMPGPPRNTGMLAWNSRCADGRTYNKPESVRRVGLQVGLLQLAPELVGTASTYTRLPSEPDVHVSSKSYVSTS